MLNDFGFGRMLRKLRNDLRTREQRTIIVMSKFKLSLMSMRSFTATSFTDLAHLMSLNLTSKANPARLTLPADLFHCSLAFFTLVQSLDKRGSF